MLRLDEGMLRLGEPERLSSDNASFAKAKDSFTLANLFSLAKRFLHLGEPPCHNETSASNNRFFLLCFLPFPYSIFFQYLQNISKWGLV